MSKKLKTLERECQEWNEKNPIGTSVQFHPVIGGLGYRVRKTRTEAYVLSGHTAVVFLEGESGCVALDACLVNPTPSEENPYIGIDE
jgi:hypothetical protein